jgi:hypothetical protein
MHPVSDGGYPARDLALDPVVRPLEMRTDIASGLLDFVFAMVVVVVVVVVMRGASRGIAGIGVKARLRANYIYPASSCAV